jgi:1-acyl-sn-glycerol-3-phosphate acyltransferase
MADAVGVTMFPPLRFLGLFLVSAVLVVPALATRALALFGARRAALHGAAAVQRCWSRAMLAVLGVDATLEGELPPHACLIVANHLSYLDILVLGRFFPGRFVAKSEIASWPVLGWLARAVGTIFVVQARRRDVVRVDREMAETLAAGVSVVLFPEGHSTRGVVVDRFKSALLESAAQARIPCLAVALHYDTPKDPWAPAGTVCWWGGMGFWSHAWNLTGLRRIEAVLRASPMALVNTDRKELAAELQRALEQRFRPIRQGPVAPHWPWRELFDSSGIGQGDAPGLRQS